MAQDREQKLQQFVENEVLESFDSFIEVSFEQAYKGDEEAPVTQNDFLNLMFYPPFWGDYAEFKGGPLIELDKEIARIKDLHDEMPENNEQTEEQDGINTMLIQEENELETLQPERQQEIIEFWKVRSLLASILMDRGEPVAKYGNACIWGRTKKDQESKGEPLKNDPLLIQIFDDWELGNISQVKPFTDDFLLAQKDWIKSKRQKRNAKRNANK